MASCTFFGHRNCPQIKQSLLKILENLIEKNGVNVFYVGNQGSFDRQVYHALKELKRKYVHIQYHIVLAYLKKEVDADLSSQEDTLFPEGLEKIHPRFAISWRNQWMLKKAEYVVVYIAHPFGGAAQFARQAEKKGKIVINLAGD